MNTRMEPGADAEHCKFVRAPADGMWVNRDLVQRGQGVHDVLLFETSYADFPDATLDGVPVDTSGVIDCSEGEVERWAVTRVIAGTPNAEQNAMLSFPPDVGLFVPPGAVLLLKAHRVRFA